MEYYYHDSAGALDYYLDMLEKMQKQVNCATGSTFSDSLALQKIIAMWSVLVSSIDTLLEDARMLFQPPPPPPPPLKYGGLFLRLWDKLF